MAFFDGIEKLPAVVTPPRPERTIGNMGAIVEAQKLYGAQPLPAKGPGTGPVGVTGKTDMSGSWGKPANG
jgi:hypothetical protein